MAQNTLFRDEGVYIEVSGTLVLKTTEKKGSIKVTKTEEIGEINFDYNNVHYHKNTTYNLLTSHYDEELLATQALIHHPNYQDLTEHYEGEETSLRMENVDTNIRLIEPYVVIDMINDEVHDFTSSDLFNALKREESYITGYEDAIYEILHKYSHVEYDFSSFVRNY